MAAGLHTFVKGSVFTAERFQGDRLVIISVRGDAFSLERKYQYTRDFNCAVGFLHDALPGQPRRLDMFDPVGGEITFGGTHVLGAALWIFTTLERRPEMLATEDWTTCIIRTKHLGDLEIHFSEARLVCGLTVPHAAFHVLPSQHHVSTSQILGLQPQFALSPAFVDLPDFFPVAALFPSHETPLIDLTASPDLLALISTAHIPPPPTSANPSLSSSTSATSTTCLFYVHRGTETIPPSTSDPTEPRFQNNTANKDNFSDHEAVLIHDVQIRTLTVTTNPSTSLYYRTEDLASPTAACTLSIYLALSAGGGPSTHHVFNFIQETLHPPCPSSSTSPPTTSSSADTAKIKSQICVEVILSADGKSVHEVTLSGRGNFWARGELMLFS